jgi:glycosyltransferase involved in cell wall biosynthesis
VKVKAGDVDELYGALQMFAENPELARTWGMRSREIARALTPEAGANKWVQVFEALHSDNFNGAAKVNGA